MLFWSSIFPGGFFLCSRRPPRGIIPLEQNSPKGVCSCGKGIIYLLHTEYYLENYLSCSNIPAGAAFLPQGDLRRKWCFPRELFLWGSISLGGLFIWSSISLAGLFLWSSVYPAGSLPWSNISSRGICSLGTVLPLEGLFLWISIFPGEFFLWSSISPGRLFLWSNIPRGIFLWSSISPGVELYSHVKKNYLLELSIRKRKISQPTIFLRNNDSAEEKRWHATAAAQ